MIIVWVLLRWIEHYSPPTLAELFSTGEIRIAVDASYPPFAVATADNLYGLDIDLGDEIGRRVGMPVRFINMGYDGLYDSLQTGQTDLIISALLVDQFRMGDVLYTREYFNAGLLLISRADNPLLWMDQLTGRTLAYEFGSLADIEARLWSRRIDQFEQRPYELPEYALDSVRLGISDAAVVDAITGRLYLRNHQDWKAYTVYVSYMPLAIAVRIDRLFVWELIDETLEEMKADGTLETLIARWL
ncbi:MAG: ABC transporter substrate-binding protein [Anaerolineae bacterium]|nr:ABC transporter substrate-binding protein [Anaerolineae bacterium]